MPVRSMVTPLRRVAVRPPDPGSDFGSAHWVQPVHTARLVEQHEAICALLSTLGSQVVELPPQPDLPDACFTYDPVFVTGRGAIELRAAKAVRAGEPAVLAAEVEQLGVPIIGRLDGQATADGGDMFWLDDHTLAVGRSYRTNRAAVDQLRAMLAEEDVTVEVFDLPHDLGPDFCLHLMSVISPVREDLAVVYEPLAPVALLQAVAERGITVVPLPEAEYPTLGCNILAVEPGVVVMANGNDATAALLREHGVQVHTYEASEINKGEGGPTCLTRPIDRD
jgi:N-dimethylarginine dimethylaminohydrolase